MANDAQFSRAPAEPGTLRGVSTRNRIGGRIGSPLCTNSSTIRPTLGFGSRADSLNSLFADAAMGLFAAVVDGFDTVRLTQSIQVAIDRDGPRLPALRLAA